MIINKEIMKKVEEVESYNCELERCIAASICPKCGSHLNHSISNVVKKTYTCSSHTCNFTHLGYL